MSAYTPEVWLTAREAAEHTRLPMGTTTRQAAAAGELCAHSVGKRQYRLTAREVDAWMMSRSHEPGRSA